MSGRRRIICTADSEIAGEEFHAELGWESVWKGRQQTTTKRKPNMKTTILMTMMLLTVAFAPPVVADELTLFDGYLSGTETAQVIDGELVVDGSGSGNSTLGTFTYTYHVNVDPVIGKGVGTSHLTFANGDKSSSAMPIKPRARPPAHSMDSSGRGCRTRSRWANHGPTCNRRRP